MAHDRIHLTPDGEVVLDLRHRWADGTTRLMFDPIELLERLAALTPRPRINLLLYYGVLGARSAWRARIAGATAERSAEAPRETRNGSPAAAVAARRGRIGSGPSDAAEFSAFARFAISPGLRRDLAEALRAEAGGFDVLACPRCAGRLELIALIEEAAVIRRILRHLGVPTEVPATRPARPPPLPIGRSDPRYDDDIAVP